MRELFFFIRNDSAQRRVAARTLLVAGILAASIALHPASAITESPVTVKLSGKVVGASGKHEIYVALWESSGFLTHPAKQIRINSGAAPTFQFQIPPGRWALSAFEDENGNGVLDMGAFGPKEPSGFWHPFHGWRKPRFTDVAVEVDRDTMDADIIIGK